MALARGQRPIGIPQTELALFSGHRPELTSTGICSSWIEKSEVFPFQDSSSAWPDYFLVNQPRGTLEMRTCKVCGYDKS